jgi:hypothetical protein
VHVISTVDISGSTNSWLSSIFIASTCQILVTGNWIMLSWPASKFEAVSWQ